MSEFQFPNQISEFVYTRSYARWLSTAKRRERFPESLDRYLDFIFDSVSGRVPSDLKDEARSLMMSMDVVGSMRSLWVAGPVAQRDNTSMYNCSFLPVDNLRAFSEALYILMQGTGVGFSVERRFVDKLPVVAYPTGEVRHLTVPDSTEGWADSVYETLVSSYKGVHVEIDYSQVRPKGAILRTKGGRASGPEPLRNALNFVIDTVKASAGRRLTTLECHDLMCLLADIVRVGGFRRAALISFSDIDDDLMRYAKDWRKGPVPLYRHRANNSSVYHGRPSREVFDREWETLRNSGSGERGIYNVIPKKMEARGGEFRSNPCGEIFLRFRESSDPWTGEGGSGQFCNLTAAVMRSSDTLESMCRKVRVATWLGAIQSTFVHFPYLRPGWHDLCVEDRLLGVDITGQADCPRLSTDPESMKTLNRVAVDTAREAAKMLGINEPAAITCGKPSGNSSQLLDCGSGIHTRYAPYYLRRVRVDAKDPLCQLIRDQGVPVDPEVGQENLPEESVSEWVATFPVKSPDGCLTRRDETAIGQLNRYLNVMRTWCSEKGHNQSTTVYVRSSEWDEVAEWVWDHFDEITGVSFLDYFEGDTIYKLMPYEEIDRETYESEIRKFPRIDYTALSFYETEDSGEGASEPACVGGSCEMDVQRDIIPEEG